MQSMKKIKNSLLNQNLPLLIVVLFALIIGIWIIYTNCTSNILGNSYRDAYLYLIQSLKLSGYHITGYEYVETLSPLIPFLTAILFKLGFVNESSLFLTTGIFYIISIIGIYYLFNIRFNKYVSALGAVFYGSLTVNLLWSGNGTLDIPSTALIILTLYTFILAIEKNQKWFYISIPLAVLSFFGKFTGALVLPLMVMYFLSKRDIFGNIKKYFKHGFGGVIAGIIIAAPFFIYYIINKIPLGFLSQAEEISGRTSVSTVAANEHLTNDLFFYFTNIPNYIYSPNLIIGNIVCIITIIGLIFIGYKLIKALKKQYLENKTIDLSFFEKIKLPRSIYLITMFLSIIGIIASILTASQFSFIISEMILFGSMVIFCICANSIFKDLNKNNKFSYDITMICLFLGYMVFFTAHLTKVNRYFTAMAPGFVFLVILSLNLLFEEIESTDKFNLKDLNKKYNLTKVIPIILIIFFIITTIGYITIDKHSQLVVDEKSTSQWIKNNLTDYENLSFASDRAPAYTWYLHKEVLYSPPANNDKVNEFLKENSTDYFLTNETVKLNGYTLNKTIGSINIYKHV